MKNNLLKAASVVVGMLLLFVIMPLLTQSVFASVSEICAIDKVTLEQIVEGALWTFFRFLAAIIAGYLLGIVLSLPCLISKTMGTILSPWYTILRITPSIVWIPALYILPRPWGSSETIPIMLGVVFSSLYVAMYITNVLRDIPDDEKIAMTAMKADFRWKWENCYWPRIVVSSVSSLRLGGSIAFTLVIVGESLMSINESLGYLLMSYKGNLAEAPFGLTVIIISGLALIIFSLCSLMAKRMGAEV